MKKLFVCNLPYETTEPELADLFAEAGTVESAKIILDKETGKSRGFGFVEMRTEAEAQAAIKRFHDANDLGRKLVVNIAREKEKRSGGRGR